MIIEIMEYLAIEVAPLFWLQGDLGFFLLETM
jgi:hypothetical protein